MRRLVAPLLLVALALVVAGCAPAAGGWLAILIVAALAIAGCAESHGVRPDAEVRPDAVIVTPPDAGEGTWSTCCESGRVASCFCPAGWACNYGMGLVVCSDGLRCGYGTRGWGDPEDIARICGEDAGVEPDAGTDAGGDWEPCCDDTTGTITTCFCPAGVECNYGWFHTCADGTCSHSPCADDAGAAVLDAG